MKVVIAQLQDHRTWIDDFNCSNKRQQTSDNVSSYSTAHCSGGKE
ncbi:hypothetical protein TorRG33x02_214160 [Trema orientale]|uniref:Uncharacterized protein n=1 Tax=Trema orientale TaxID=63057 RepID=A0A2P5EBC7_TREOI|nr:hypothetical protein TorRG33x02_214160 [Trema orientale]